MFYWYVYVSALVGVIAAWVIYIRRSLPKKGTRTIWRCIRREGGGTVETPYPMDEENAVEFVSKNLGSVMYVDRTHYFIFYRPRTGT